MVDVAQGFQATEALADALASAIRALPGKLREVEVPSLRNNLEQVAEQLTAMAARLRTLRKQLGAAGDRLGDKALLASGSVIVAGLDAAAHVATLLRPDERGLLRLVPKPITQPYLDGVGTIEAGLRAASDLTRIFVAALPELGNALRDVSEDLDRAAELLDGTSRAIRELARVIPL